MHIWHLIEGLALWTVAGIVVGLFLGRIFDHGDRWGLVLVILLGCASSASAQTHMQKPAWSAYTVLVAGNVADLWTTQAALASGRGYEGNPALWKQGIGQIAIAKTGGVLVLVGAMRFLETHGHPKIARALGFIDGGVTVSAALHNTRVGRSK